MPSNCHCSAYIYVCHCDISFPYLTLVSHCVSRLNCTFYVSLSRLCGISVCYLTEPPLLMVSQCYLTEPSIFVVSRCDLTESLRFACEVSFNYLSLLSHWATSICVSLQGLILLSQHIISLSHLRLCHCHLCLWYLSVLSH